MKSLVHGPDHLDLDERDVEVLTLLTWGRTNAQISSQLGVSLSTAKTFIRCAYRNIGVTSRTQAIVWGYRHGLIPRPISRPGRPGSV